MAVAAGPALAWADELADVRAELSEKTDELEFLVEGIGAEKARIAQIDKEMDKLLADLGTKQADYARLQNEASELAEVMYKDASDFNVLSLLLDSGSMEEFLVRLDVRDHVLSASSETLEELHRVQDDLKASYDKASSEKDERNSLLSDMKSKQTELNKIIAELKERESELDFEQKAALAQAAAAAHETAKTFDTKLSDDGALKGDEWKVGLASAYGGSSDSSTPNPGTTATGTRCDDWSVGVAVPIAWGPSKYYGRYVEISYNGQSIVAPVVDCGGMGNGSRALDLQPGVFKAFGANTCDSWGVREVHYRFL